MNIVSIGSYYEHKFVDNINFRSSISFLDYDLAIIDFENILDEYQSNYLNSTYNGHKCLDNSDSFKILNDLERRKYEIIEMLKLGRTIIVIKPFNNICYAYTGEKKYSGTGKNRQTTNFVGEINLFDILPVKIESIKASGTCIDFKGDEIFYKFWDKNKDILFYQAYFMEKTGKEILYIKGTNKSVCSYFSIFNGNLIFLPSIDCKNKKIENDFYLSLIELVNDLNKSTGDFKLPIWCNQYILPEEDNLNTSLIECEKELKNINKKTSEQKNKLAKLEEYKILFSGNGKALEVQVKRIFCELGFEVTEGLPGRDDLILKYGDKVAVVEVKGLSKSAAEKNAAQLEKWVSEYYSINEIMPKGILIVNAFKDTPLKDRTEDAFPNQMLDYCVNRKHCLISGIQLLGLYLFCIKNKSRINDFVDKIFNTNGVFDDFKDWTSFVNNTNEMVLEEKQAV